MSLAIETHALRKVYPPAGGAHRLQTGVGRGNHGAAGFAASGPTVALETLDLAVRSGEFFCLSVAS